MEIDVLRALERILIVTFGGISIILGWHLFKIGVVSEANGVFEGKGFKAVLQKAGPGIFFSLFGSIVLLTALVFGLRISGKGTLSLSSLQKPQQHSSISDKEPPVAQDFSLVMLGESGKSKLKKVALAINTLDLVDPKFIPYTDNRDAFATATKILKNHRDKLISNAFKEEVVAAYKKCLKNNDSECPETPQTKEIGKWRNEDLL